MEYTEVDIILNPITPFSEILIGELGEIGFESFAENDLGFKAYIPSKDFDKKALEDVFDNMSAECEIKHSVTNIEDQNWNAVWESSYESVLIDDFCFVYAPFHEKRADIPYNILIEPKMSFGTAHHPTTHLMISFLKDENLEEKRVLDMGSGTGVLAIFASMRGASYIEAIDNDSWAYENAIENVRNNRRENISVLLGDASLLKDKSFDIVLANINRNILLNDIKTYAQCLNTGGFLFLSGFFESDIPTILDEAGKYEFSLEGKRIRNDWASIKLVKR